MHPGDAAVRGRAEPVNDALIYLLFLVAGLAVGGAYSIWKNIGNAFLAGVLAAVAVIAAVGGVLQLV